MIIDCYLKVLNFKVLKFTEICFYCFLMGLLLPICHLVGVSFCTFASIRLWVLILVRASSTLSIGI